jgi:hypothetical protein
MASRILKIINAELKGRGRRFQKEGEVGREQKEIKRGLGKREVLCMIDWRTHDKSLNER